MELFKLFGSVVVKDNASATLDTIEKKADKTDQKIGLNFGSIGKGATKLGKGLFTKLSIPIMAVGGVAVKTGMNFEKSMSEVKAISGATGKDLKKLENKARELGATTSKSAKDGADAIKYMALAGWKTEDMLQGLEPMLRLSEAGNLDLAKASDLVTDSMSAMGIEVKDLPHYLNVIAQTSRNSNTEIDQMGEAYIRCGGVLKGLNVPLKESASMIGVLGNNGIKGGEAGTALTAVITNLTAPTGRAKEALKELNISAFDSQGKFKGLTNVLTEVKDKTNGLTEEQKQQYLSMIGGKEHIKDLNALLNGLDKDLPSLTKKLGNVDGALNNMALTAQDNAKGSITQLKSALEELGIKIFDKLKPAIKDITETFQKWTDKLNNLTPAQADLLLKIAKILVVAPILILAFGKICTAITILKKAFDILCIGIGLVGKAVGLLMANPIILVIGAIIAIVVGLVIVIVKNWDAIKAKTLEVWNAIATFFTELWNGIKQIFTTVMDAILGVVTTVWNAIKTAITVVILAIKFVIETVFTIIVTIIRIPLEFISALFTTIWNYIGDFVMGIVNGIADGLSIAWNFIAEVTSTVFNGIKDFFVSIWQGIVDFIIPIINGIKDLFSSVWNGIKNVTEAVWNGIRDFFINTWNGIVNFITPIINFIANLFSSVWNGIKNVTTKVWNGIKDAITKPIQKAKDIIGGIIDGIKKVFEKLKLKFPKIKMPKLPHFKMKGEFSLKPLSVPHLGIDWYKEGGIMTRPTMFGMNGNRPMVGGEAGAEAVLPIEKLSGILANTLTELGFGNNNADTIIQIDGKEVFRAISPQMASATRGRR